LQFLLGYVLLYHSFLSYRERPAKEAFVLIFVCKQYYCTAVLAHVLALVMTILHRPYAATVKEFFISTVNNKILEPSIDVGNYM